MNAYNRGEEIPEAPLMPHVSISRILFSGGNEFYLNPNEKVLLVGPNNSGKSQTLREIVAICEKGYKAKTKVVSKLSVEKSGHSSDLRAFLEYAGDIKDGVYRYKDWQIQEYAIDFYSRPYLTDGLSRGFVKSISADDRLLVCEQQESIPSGAQKSKPQHILYDDEMLMRRISELFRLAFRKDIMFDFRGGSKLPIHVGEITSIDVGLDRVSDSYVNAVRANPLLDEQGDGMKSYAGILFEAVVANRDVTLIDEPEAFLHPPQMRRLGETLSSEVRGQLMVATHSSDIMRGFLEGTRGNVRILRIRRHGCANLVSEATPDVIKELWEKPELRYSNALEGIFHDQTVICEDDSDCRLINSIADHLSIGSDRQWQDTAYVPTGGKHGIPKVARVLRQIGVPVKAVFDIDFLSERSLVEETVIAFGGDWREIEPFWSRVDSAVRNGRRAKSNEEIKQDVISILNQAPADDLPKGDVIEALKQGKPWAVVKKHGTSGIPKGDAQCDYIALRDKLEGIGVYIVPVGEMEGFCPEIGSHGPRFVTKLLETLPLGDMRLEALRSFVEKVLSGSHGAL